MMLRAMSRNGIRLFSTVRSLPKIGFIGLGNMGSHMANNLLKAGYPVVVHDINSATLKTYIEKGAVVAQSPLEVAGLVDAVITMLPSPISVCDVYLGKNGLLPKQPSKIRPFLLIDASTVDPKTSHKISSAVQQCSLLESSRHIADFNHPIMLDAPVSGGVLGAQAGTLTFMVGGTEEGCKAAKPILACMGKNVFYCGGSGNGAAAKLCNNLALSVSMAGISEALSLGQKLGIDACTLSKIFNTSTARCWSSDTYNPVPGVMEGVPASRDYLGGCSCHIIKKDLGLAVAAAEESEALSPLARQVFTMYSDICDNGDGKKDFSGIFKYIYKGSSEELMVPQEDVPNKD